MSKAEADRKHLYPQLVGEQPGEAKKKDVGILVGNAEKLKEPETSKVGDEASLIELYSSCSFDGCW